jgi:hypothetical protein
MSNAYSLTLPHLNGRFQQAFTDLTVTLSSTIITQLAAAKQVSTQLASPVGVIDTPIGGITEHDARSAQLPTERPSIDPTMRPMAPAPATTVPPAALPDEDYHIDTKLWGPYLESMPRATPPGISTAHKSGSLPVTPTATSPPFTTPRSKNTAPRHVTPPALTRRAYQLWKTFKMTPRTHQNSRRRSSPCIKATTPTARSRRPPVCGYPTSGTPRTEGRRAIRTAFSRNSPTSVSSNRDRMLPPPSTTTYTERSSRKPSSVRYWN